MKEDKYGYPLSPSRKKFLEEKKKEEKDLSKKSVEKKDAKKQEGTMPESKKENVKKVDQAPPADPNLKKKENKPFNKNLSIGLAIFSLVALVSIVVLSVALAVKNKPAPATGEEIYAQTAVAKVVRMDLVLYNDGRPVTIKYRNSTVPYKYKDLAHHMKYTITYVCDGKTGNYASVVIAGQQKKFYFADAEKIDDGTYLYSYHIN